MTHCMTSTQLDQVLSFLSPLLDAPLLGRGRPSTQFDQVQVERLCAVAEDAQLLASHARGQREDRLIGVFFES